MARILLAKIGTDAHDHGVRMVAKWLADAGHEVIYAGLYNTCEGIARMAVDEDPDLVGISYLGGEPVYLSGRLLESLGKVGLDGIPLVVGGVITPEMSAELQALGVAAVFTPGTPRDQLLGQVGALLAAPATG